MIQEQIAIEEVPVEATLHVSAEGIEIDGDDWLIIAALVIISVTILGWGWLKFRRK